LNGATRTPWRASQRQIPAVRTDFPASDVVPATSSDPLVLSTGPAPFPSRRFTAATAKDTRNQVPSQRGPASGGVR
jgi:hypothetical protein